MNAQAKTLIEQLQDVVARVRGYSYDVWMSTDLADDTSVMRSSQLARALKDPLNHLRKAASEVTDVIQQFAGIDLDEGSVSDAATLSTATDEAVSQTKALKVFSLAGDYTNRFPYGFRLLGQSYLGVSMWARLYEVVLQRLAQSDPVRFQNLPDNKEFQGGRKHGSDEYRMPFARAAKTLHSPYQVTGDVYADIGYSASYICVNISKLLKEFRIPESEFQLYLRRSDRKSPPVEKE